MKLRLFVEQPSIKMTAGVRVTKDTEFIYKNDSVEQVVKELHFETIKKEKGTNGFNSYETTSLIKIQLNEGDILLFDKDRGYYLPKYPATTIEDAIGDISSIEEFDTMEIEEAELTKEVEDDTTGDGEEGSKADRGN